MQADTSNQRNTPPNLWLHKHSYVHVHCKCTYVNELCLVVPYCYTKAFGGAEARPAYSYAYMALGSRVCTQTQAHRYATQTLRLLLNKVVVL